MQNKKTIKHFLFVFLTVCLIGFLYFNLSNYFNFSTLQKYHQLLTQMVNQNYFLAVLLYVLIYISIVMLSMPATIFLALAGGFLFGLRAIFFAIGSATIGSAIVFLIVRNVFRAWFIRNSGRWIAKMEKGFQKNAFNYLLVLRLLPIFPFSVINIVSALLAVNFRKFILATILGTIPPIFVYVNLGHGFKNIFNTNQSPNLNIIFTPSILLPLLGFAILSLLPIILKKKESATS